MIPSSSLADGFQWIESFTNFERKTANSRDFRLDRMHKALEKLGHPEESIPAIHIAGSKGKGSTAALIAAVLNGLNYRVAVYSSPHVSDYRERFRIPGYSYEENQLLAQINELQQLFFNNQLPEPTSFELLTLLFFLFARDNQCDYMILETGLGGRLDATNVVKNPLATVITSIELEHTEILGDTISQIAAEKAGIIKPNSPTFIGELPEEAHNVILAKAKNLGASLFDSAISTEVKRVSPTGKGEIIFSDGFVIPTNLRLVGMIQQKNAALAASVIRYIFPDTSKDVFTKAFSDVELPARMQIITNPHTIIIDGAHTPSSIETNLAALKSVLPEGGVLIFGAVEGKNVNAMAEKLTTFFKQVILCKPGDFKTSNMQGILKVFNKYLPDQEIPVFESIADAIAAAEKIIKESGKADFGLCITGSFYLAGMAVNFFKSQKTMG